MYIYIFETVLYMHARSLQTGVPVSSYQARARLMRNARTPTESTDEKDVAHLVCAVKSSVNLAGVFARVVHALYCEDGVSRNKALAIKGNRIGLIDSADVRLVHIRRFSVRGLYGKMDARSSAMKVKVRQKWYSRRTQYRCCAHRCTFGMRRQHKICRQHNQSARLFCVGAPSKVAVQNHA